MKVVGDHRRQDGVEQRQSRLLVMGVSRPRGVLWREGRQMRLEGDPGLLADVSRNVVI